MRWTTSQSVTFRKAQMTRFAPLALLATAALLLFAPSAGAAQCGSEPAGGGEALEGNLQIDAAASTTSLDFGRSSKSKSVVLVFDVSGCTLTPAAAEGIVAKPHASEGQAAFGAPEIEVEGNQLSVEIPVDRDEFGAGTHTAAVTVHGPSIAAATTVVSYQRSEGYLWPTLLAFLCGLVGFGAAVATKTFLAEGDAVKVKLLRLLGAVIAAAVGAGSVWLASYGKAPLWQATPEAVIALGVGAVTAAYGGAGAALIGKSATNAAN